VTVFDESVPLNVLDIVRPDIYVKGGDYDMDRIEEARLVRTWGGTALALPFVAGHSTTGTVRRLRGGR
jgi:bifunctional ADP-heptose synthase (sugar kinase/adenylyltransferase)